jgi:mono/diheme cytochrome c family protein
MFRSERLTHVEKSGTRCGPRGRARGAAIAALLPLVAAATALAIATMTGAEERPAHDADVRPNADLVYTTACAPCHGDAGDGAGPAAFSIAPGVAPRPRDFTKGSYKLRSTPSGAVPTDADLHRTIAHGIPRYMPAFAPLGDDVIAALVARIKRFSPRFADPPPALVRIPEVPALDADMATRGARVYEELGCAACHGPEGKGNGPAAAALRDTTGLPIWPANLARPSWFKGGSSPSDVYRTLMTGMDGTPMPGYGDVFAGLAAEKPWQLIAYIASLSRE